MSRLILLFSVIILIGCVTAKEPLHPVDPNNPFVWDKDRCEKVPDRWWGQQGEEPNTTNDVWKCGRWMIVNY